jgi:hypothetical protein
MATVAFLSSRRVIRVLSVVFALAVASGLVTAQTPAPAPAPTPAQAPAVTMAGYPAPGEPAKVRLVSTGAEPRKALRYSIPADFKSHLDMTIAVSMTMSLLGQPLEMPVPVIKMGADVRVTTIAANGDISYSLAFTGMALEGDTTSSLGIALQAATTGISGIKGVTTITSRGVTKSSSLEVSDDALRTMLAQTGSSVENVSIAFPEESVGVGAQWEVRQAVVSDGPTQFQQATYEVTAIDGLAVTLKVTTVNTAPAQAIISPLAAATGGDMRLEALRGTGTGTVAVRLDSVVPTSTIEHATSATMSLTVQGQAVPVTVDGKVRIAVAPVKRP